MTPLDYGVSCRSMLARLTSSDTHESNGQFTSRAGFSQESSFAWNACSLSHAINIDIGRYIMRLSAN